MDEDKELNKSEPKVDKVLSENDIENSKRQIMETIDELWMQRMSVLAFVGIFMCNFVRLFKGE